MCVHTHTFYLRDWSSIGLTKRVSPYFCIRGGIDLHYSQKKELTEFFFFFCQGFQSILLYVEKQK